MNTGTLLRTLSLGIILAGLYNCKRGSSPEHKIAPVDSLIEDQWINETTYMVSFGSEAITAINTEKGIVVVDAGISTNLTQKYRTKVEQVFQHGRFSYIINTHAHHDHYRGNSAFPEAQVIGHENGLLEMEEYWKDPAQVEKSLGSIAKEYGSKALKSSPGSEEWYHNVRQQIRYQKRI